VLSPEFIARNPIRDQLSAFLFSGSGFKPYLDMARGIFSLARKDASYQEWLRSGGPMASLVSMDRAYLQTGLRDLIEQGGLWQSSRNVLLHPIEGLRALSELAENATRLGEFKRSRAKGATIPEAGFASREVTLDFNRAGIKGQAANRIIAFFNAQLQGADKMAREFKKNPTRMTA
jgi:hypothetical protein